MTDYPDLKLFLSESEATLARLGEWGYGSVAMLSLDAADDHQKAARSRDVYFQLTGQFGVTLFGGTTGIVLVVRTELRNSFAELEEAVKPLADLYVIGTHSSAKFVSPSGEVAVSPLVFTVAGVVAWANRILPEWGYKGTYPMDATYIRHKNAVNS